VSSFVLDCSVAVAWLLEDERVPGADVLLDRLDGGGQAVVPGLWRLELGNVLAGAERRGRIAASFSRARLVDLAVMRISCDHDHNDRIVLDLAREHGLSVQDSAYIETALRRSLPLASLDRRLCDAAAASGVTLIQP